MSSELNREARDRTIPRGLFIPVRRSPHRPLTRYRVRIENRGDASRARKTGLPLHYLGREELAAWGFPSSRPDVLVLARELASLVETSLPVATLESSIAARTPRLEDLVVVLLQGDILLARALALRHRRFLDPNRLLKRVLQENLEEAATKVGLQRIIPALPRVGESLPEAALARQDRNAWVGGRL